MFEHIGATLPTYEQFLSLLQDHARRRQHLYPRLAKALGLVYLDILRFCHGAYLLFSNQNRSMPLSNMRGAESDTGQVS
jgi:hypothetical protein